MTAPRASGCHWFQTTVDVNPFFPVRIYISPRMLQFVQAGLPMRVGMGRRDGSCQTKIFSPKKGRREEMFTHTLTFAFCTACYLLPDQGLPQTCPESYSAISHLLQLPSPSLSQPQWVSSTCRWFFTLTREGVGISFVALLF